ncbi:ATP-binding protein [Alicyclobacillus fodiniaquatilis]|uniref:histidine kinase n=1 Tax=Alicyclobacillus fodiniaquatilis TaxID=1661150 RepID=A0ABW4JIM4_9BACL
MQSIHLKRDLEIENGAHILYVFHNKSCYIDNLVAYVIDGIKLDHLVMIVERSDVYQEVLKRLSRICSKEALQYVFFDDADTFYGVHTEFQTDKIVQHFEDFLKSLPQTNRTIRTWASVVWRAHKDIMSQLIQYENNADDSVKEGRLVSVCAYDEANMPSGLLIDMLKNHDYFMTDTELVRSPLYNRGKAVFPSLSVQSKIESEMDFYKSKLDFVHVVSHEVRNPLTIINGYANILRTSEPNLSSEGLEKLVAIGHYVNAIDQELSHIIETEQMLSNDLYMKLETIYPFDAIHEVVQLMQTKSFVENVAFVTHLYFDPRYSMLGNLMGLKLILSNLISNAIKYTGEQGTVEFSATVQDYRIQFVVKDDGVGMSRNQLNALYQKYARVDESKSGQGIGLYVVKHLTDRFHGHISFESELGQGTKVTVEFPILGRSEPLGGDENERFNGARACPTQGHQLGR